MKKTGWEITRISVSTRSGFMLEGINHDASSPLDRIFHWHIAPKYLDNDRYSLSENVIIDEDLSPALRNIIKERFGK